MWENCDYTFYIIRHFLPQYKHYFYIENDCYFNGKYIEFFKLYAQNEADVLLTRFCKEPQDSQWEWTRDIAWEFQSHEYYGCYFPLERLSGVAIDILYKRRVEIGKKFIALDSNIKAQWINCELFVASESMRQRLKVDILHQKISGEEIDLNNTRLFENPDNKMYHPIKGNFLKRLASKESECAHLRDDLAYKIGQAYLKADSKWYKGILRFYFKAKALKHAFKRKQDSKN